MTYDVQYLSVCLFAICVSSLVSFLLGRLCAPQPFGHAGHVQLQQPVQDTVPVPANHQLQHRAQRPGHLAPGEPQLNLGEVWPPGAFGDFVAPEQLWPFGEEDLPGRPHAHL